MDFIRNGVVLLFTIGFLRPHALASPGPPEDSTGMPGARLANSQLPSDFASEYFPC